MGKNKATKATTLQVILLISLLFGGTVEAVYWDWYPDIFTSTPKCADKQPPNSPVFYSGNYPGIAHDCHIPARLDPKLTTHLICPVPTEADFPPLPTPPTTTTPSTTTTTTPTTPTTTTPPPPPTTVSPLWNVTANPNATTTTTTPPPTSPTTTPTTPPTTTTPVPLQPNQLPHHGNKCLYPPEYRDLKSSTTWSQRWTKEIMIHELELFEPCDIYFRATKPELPYHLRNYEQEVRHTTAYPNGSILDDLSCNSPFSTFPTERRDLVLGHNMSEIQKNLMPLKQRRTKGRSRRIIEEPIECLTTQIHALNNSWMASNGTIPLDYPEHDKIPLPETCLHCPKTVHLDSTNPYASRSFRDQIEVMDGYIEPFAFKGESCSLENEAYLHGAILSSIVDDPNFGSNPEEDIVEGYPWGRLHKFWPRLVNLHVADIDKDGGTGEPECSKGDYFSKMLHGDCVFNQRLAIDPLEVVEGCKGTSYMCRGSQVNPHRLPLRKHEFNYDIPTVALGCAPQHYLICGQDYNDDQMMESRCGCHPLYSVENRKPSRKRPWQCLPMAGVPCRFERNLYEDRFSSLLFKEVECAEKMRCEDLKVINRGNGENKSNWEFFERSFTGFGMSPIARDYLVKKATGMCVCKEEDDGKGGKGVKYIQTPFNECLEPRKNGAGIVVGWKEERGGGMKGKGVMIGMLVVVRCIIF